MARESLLGAFEELVLLAIAHEGDNAYGMRVRRSLQRRSKRSITIGAVYATLDRLQAKGLVRSSERIGADDARARRYFTLTPEGARVLLRAARLHETMWDGIDREALSAHGRSG